MPLTRMSRMQVPNTSEVSSVEHDDLSDDSDSSFSLPATNEDNSSSSNSVHSNLSRARSEVSESNFSESPSRSNEETFTDDTEEYDLNGMDFNATGGPSNENVVQNSPRNIQGNNSAIEIADTQDDEVPRRNSVPHTTQVIEINDTQIGDEAAAGAHDEDDDDVILIPQHVETIDLCTQTQFVAPCRRHFTSSDEVIVIHDSPAGAPSKRTSLRKSRRQSKTSPYKKDETKSPPKSQSIICPVCLESVCSREPVSTTCGHIYCKACLVTALGVSKCCPMCKKSLKAKNSFHSIYLFQ